MRKSSLIAALAVTAVAFIWPVSGQEKPAPDASATIKEIVGKAEALNLADHIKATQALNDSVARRLLTPDVETAKKHAAFSPGTAEQGLARMLNRGTIDFEFGVRGGGAYWSFSKRSNSYNETPELELQEWSFSSGFAGRDCGFVEAIAGKALTEVTLNDISETLKREFKNSEESDVLKKLDNERHRNRLPKPKAEVGKIFVVRAVSIGEADTLAVFEVLAKDEWGITIAWRILKRFTPPER